MFTGIIDHCGEIISVEQTLNSLVIWIRSLYTDLVEGESIAVDGVCLTVTEPQSGLFRCDVSPETFALTTAACYQPQQQVNLERALRLSDRLGGHLVMGHVDQTCSVTSIRSEKEFLEINFHGLTSDTQCFFTKKGSVAINGVSLTVNAVVAGGFQVMLIPHTLGRTTLGKLACHDKVNVEFDWLNKVIVQQVRERLTSLV